MLNQYILFFIFLSSLFLGSQGKAEQKQICLPVVNMSDFYNLEKKEEFLDTLYEAMTTCGFFGVLKTGINEALIKEAYNQSKQFFKQEADYKLKYYDPKWLGQRGFVPGEFAKGNLRKDRKEFYLIGKEVGFMENVWPDQRGFEEVFVSFYHELDQYTIPLQEAIIEAINRKITQKIPVDFLSNATKMGDNLLRVIYYPALEEKPSSTDPLYWSAPHTDIDFLAIIPRATEKGLQVEFNNEWLNVVVPEDAFIVNIGDMLTNLTNGLLVSAKHRVLAQEANKERFSMVLFVHPYGEAPLDPLPACFELTGGKQKFANGTRNEFLWERLIELEIGGPHLLKAYSETGHLQRQLEYGRESPKVVDLLIKSELAIPDIIKKRVSS